MRDKINSVKENITKFATGLRSQGFDFQLGSVGLFVEGRFHNVFGDPENSNFIPITAGISLGGGGAGS